MVWLRNLFFLALWAIVALVVRFTTGIETGWMVFSVGVLALLLWHLFQLNRFAQWTYKPREAPPRAWGSWEDAQFRLHRHLRRLERDIAEGRETLQSWLAASTALPDGVVVMDSNFHIEWCNREARRSLGLRFPADRGQNLLNLVRSPEFVRYAQQGEWPEPARVPAPGRPDRVLMVQIIEYSRRRRLLVARDVTQLERIETTRRDFVANVSHELRTPLTVLSGFLETLAEAPPGALTDEQREHYLELMREQSQRMQNIVGDLLTLSTLESTQVPEYPGPAGMANILATVRSEIEALSKGRHTITWEIDEALDILGTSSELSSAVSNLLTNAVRYTPAGGKISVYWRALDDGRAEFSVSDTGIGLDAKHIPRITERFYRVDRGRSRASGGTGLGLAITKHVAIRHDAQLDVKSEPGRGSTFSLRFPADRVIGGVQADASQAADSDTAPTHAAGSRFLDRAAKQTSAEGAATEVTADRPGSRSQNENAPAAASEQARGTYDVSAEQQQRLKVNPDPGSTKAQAEPTSQAGTMPESDAARSQSS